ncbi:hypothetical protein H9P43_002912 [Blastocladiella emersonii ATCC 22665]|nr:hypothetical protein H9P43_002912 [Blastocladiella emersonii ATCC 22665]
MDSTPTSTPVAPPAPLSDKDRIIQNTLRSWRTAVPEEMSSWYFPAALTTALCLVSLPKSGVKYPGLPPYLQLAGFTTMFAVSTHAVKSGDTVNGPSMATAWSLTYLVANSWKAVRSRNLIPLSIVASAMMQVGVYGVTAAEEFYYGDKDLAVRGSAVKDE